MEDATFGRLPKGLKKLGRPLQRLTRKGPLKTVKKILRKTTAATAGVVTAGLVKPKFLGIKQKGSVKFYRVGGLVGKVAAVAVAPALLGTSWSAIGSATWKGLTIAGGKVKAMPPKIANFLKGKGTNPATASPSEIVDAGLQTGAFSVDDAVTIAKDLGVMPPITPTPDYPGGADFPARPGYQSPEEGVKEERPGILAQYPWVLPVGAGAIAIGFLATTMRRR